MPAFDWLRASLNLYEYERLIVQSDNCMIDPVPFDGYLPDKLTKTGKERLMRVLRICTD